MKNYLSLIKFSHTIFALPFAMLGFFLGVQEVDFIPWRIFLLVVFCMVFARNAAMAFNRYRDRDIDEKNPRTATREIPAGVISPKSALAFVLINCFLFVLTTWFINPLCFYLSPIALLVILGYTYTKRFTFLCHFVLGLGLSFAPIGAYIAVTGTFALIPVLYGVAVLLWVAGFDIIYALQDQDFDKSLELKSVPVVLGTRKSLLLSTILHIICASIILYTGYLIAAEYQNLSWLHWLGAIIFVILLIYQHILVKPDDLSKVNLAFFTTNGVASVIFGVLVIVDLLI